MSISDKNDKRALLLRILDWIKAEDNYKFEGTRKRISQLVLEVDIQREDYDKQFFFSYLDSFPIQASFLKREEQEKRRDKTLPSLSLPFRFATKDDESLTVSYLNGLFGLPGAPATLEQAKKYFNEERVSKLYAVTILLAGGSSLEAEKHLGVDEVRKIKEKKSLEILESTKKYLKVEDEVELKLRVKNLSRIRVKIFQVDLEKRYLQNLSLDESQDLSFLNPTDSFVYEVDNSNPYKEARYDIKVEQIGKSRGMWIVELEGDEVSSRAVICKGAITSINRVTTNGVELHFYDESGCPIEDMHLWMNEKKHTVSKKYLIPFGESNSQVKLIVVHQSLADTLYVNVPMESYEFKVGYIYGSESFISGNKAKIVLHPRLKISNTDSEVSLKLLKKARVRVELVNNLNIKNSLDFDGVAFSNSEDYLLEFPIQSYTKFISISVDADISLYSGKEQHVSSSKRIVIDLNENTTNFLDLYLRRTNEGECIYLLGKNGEPVPQC